jgi:hypothetical protein
LTEFFASAPHILHIWSSYLIKNGIENYSNSGDFINHQTDRYTNEGVPITQQSGSVVVPLFQSMD